MLDEDIGPDQVHLDWEAVKNGKNDKYLKAMEIVNNFEKIESYWKSIEQHNVFWKSTTFILGTILLLSFFRHG